MLQKEVEFILLNKEQKGSKNMNQIRRRIAFGENKRKTIDERNKNRKKICCYLCTPFEHLTPAQFHLIDQKM
jgi:hypothetical protein